MKWRFAIKFLGAFAILLVIWWWIDFPIVYRSFVLRTAQWISPVVNGWWLDFDQPGLVNDVTFRSGEQQLAMLLQLPALSMGLVPLLSLILATPGQRPIAACGRAALAAALYFLVDLIVVVTYPVIMDRPNVVKDTFGVFTGLMAFVVAPLGLWFVVTYPLLRPLWRLTPSAR